MKKLPLLNLFCALLFASISQGQTDSIRLEVTKTRTGADKTYYWLKDGENRKYYTVCSCEQKHKKGEFVTISKKDIPFIEPKNY